MKKLLSKCRKGLTRLVLPFTLIMMYSSIVLAESDLERKLGRSKLYLLGIAETVVTIAVFYTLYLNGTAKHQDEIEKAEKYRARAIKAWIGVTSIVGILAMWKSW